MMFFGMPPCPVFSPVTTAATPATIAPPWIRQDGLRTVASIRPSLTANGEVIVVDADRPTQYHGTPPALLKCEFAAVGYQLVQMASMPSAGGYFAAFKAVGPRPKPQAIKSCRLARQDDKTSQ